MKRVFVALRMAGIAGQEKLSGIFRFLGDASDWDITLIRTAAEFSPARVQAAIQDGHDGFIVSIPDMERSSSLLASVSTPTVVLDIHDAALSRRAKNIAFIWNDPQEIGREAANFLVSTGRCRSYAFVHSASVREWGVDRFRAYRETLRDFGLWTHELNSPDEIRRLKRPVGVFAANDDRGYDTLEYCRTHNLRVPEDVLVLGTNNDTLICENCHPPLTSVQPDFNEEGYLAAQTLSRLMSAGHGRRAVAACGAQTLYVGVKTIVRRASTAEVSLAGKLVQKAIAHIRRHATRGLTVGDVVRHLGCSRRLADLRFQQLQGTTIGETITSCQLEEVCRRLTATRDPIDRIATDCGYGNANYLRTLFKRRFGLTMRAYRERESPR